MGLKKQLTEGEMIKVTLEFEKAGDVPVMINVLGPLAKGPAGMGDMDHGEMNHNKMDHKTN